MSEEQIECQEYTFINRTAGISSAEAESLEPAMPEKEKKVNQHRIKLQGEFLVAVFQSALCIIMLLIFLVFHLIGGSVADNLFAGYQYVTEMYKLDIPAYFEPITESSYESAPSDDETSVTFQSGVPNNEEIVSTPSFT